MVTVTKYVWDPVFDCVTSELDESNAVKSVYHNEPQQYGGVLSQRRGTTSHYHHHDALGSTRFLTDSSGNVTDTYLNDAWGNAVATTGSTVNPFKWVGKYGYYTDDSTGQVHVRARMYRPAVGRFLLSPYLLASLASATNGHSDNDKSGTPSTDQLTLFRWTCETALQHVYALRDLWKRKNLNLSVALLDLFLKKKGGNENDMYDFSEYCHYLTSDINAGSVNLKIDLATKVTYGEVDAATCRNGGIIRLNDIVPTSSGLPQWFETELAPLLELLADVADDVPDGLHDIQYALGTAHVGVVGGQIIVSPRDECCCNWQFKGSLQIVDRFGFKSDWKRNVTSSHFAAAAFLQKHCDGYKVPVWKMQCPIELSSVKCHKIPTTIW